MSKWTLNNMSAITRANLVKLYGKEPETLTELAYAIIKTIRQRTKIIGLTWNIKLVSDSDGKLGWAGRIWVKYDPVDYLKAGDDTFSETSTYLGTGGISVFNGPWTDTTERYAMLASLHIKNRISYNKLCMYSWNYKIVKEDWPELSRSVDYAIMLAKLKGEEYYPIHAFTWNDEDAVAAEKVAAYELFHTGLQ